MKNTNNLGVLYVVATPIGNLEDITFRAIETLKKVDFIIAENTRHSQFLLQHYHISKLTISLHEHNEQKRLEQLVIKLQQGQSIALISDAGTPLISDPGYLLVSQARKMGIAVVPIPGACAAITALSVAGLPTDRFSFEGFLPAKSHARLNRLNLLKNETRTMIFYEAPHRIIDLLQDLKLIFGAKHLAVLARELTKIFETVCSGTLEELLEWVNADANQQRGEMVVLVAGVEENLVKQGIDVDFLLGELLQHLPLKKAVAVATHITGQKKNDLYQRALALK